MEKIEIKQLVALNLKYGSSMKPLKTVAFAQLSAKALFLVDKPVDIKVLSDNIARLIGIKNVSEQLIADGLTYLIEINKARNSNNQWFLTPQARKEISQDLDHTRNQLQGVLKRHFPASMDHKRLKNWFVEAAASFFSYFGEEWVVSLSKGIKKHFLKHKTIEELLNPSIESFGFKSNREDLVGAFTNFLSSEDVSDQQYLMLISQAMFSARLVAADVGVDLLTLQEMKDAKFILDTNILFALVLDHHNFFKSIIELEEALKVINGEFVYLYVTKEEYERALEGRKNEILHWIKLYPLEVLEDTCNDMIATAKAKNCKSVEDYEQFFISLRTIPAAMPKGHPIILEDDSKIAKIVQESQNDTKLKDQIQNFAKKMRARWKGPKREPALNHDAALCNVARFINKEGKKCWILSLDKSLQACSVEQTDPLGIPHVISVAALIEILAVNNAGPAFDSSNFAPLLSRIIINECTPPINTYILHDLRLLYSINEKAVDLPVDDVKRLLKEVTKARIEGGGPPSTSLQLKINRMYQDGRENLDEKLKMGREKVKEAHELANQERQKREKREEELIKIGIGTIKRTALMFLILQFLIEALLVILGYFFLTKIYCKLFDCSDTRALIRDIVSGITIIALGWKPFSWSWKKYKQKCLDARKTATQNISRQEQGT